MTTVTKTGTYKPSTSSVATPGTSSAANTALQQSLIAKGAKITVDGKYGPQTAAAVAQFGGSSTTPTNTNPTITSTSVRSDNAATGVDISKLKAAYAADNARIEAEKAALAERRTLAVNDIKTQSEIDAKAQEKTQAKDYAARSTSLITSGGGFLGATQSQEGVLQNLKSTFDTERTALTAKRDAAINAANQAYEDKDFALAKELSKNAKDLQNDIYRRETDFADQQLKIASANRSQTEFDVNMADKKATAYAAMDDNQYATVSPDEKAAIDKNYFPGYTDVTRDLNRKALTLKNAKEQAALDIDIIQARQNTPAGKTIKIAGVTYSGMKTELSSMTQSDRDTLNKQKVQSWFTSATKIPGTDSVPFLDNNGFATPEGWQTAYEYSGMDRRKFIQEFGYLLAPTGKDSENNPIYDKYGLVPAEVKLVNTLIPVNY